MATKKDPHGPEPEAPSVVALLLCERVVADKTTGHLSLMNVIAYAKPPAFPYLPVPPYWAFAIVTGLKAPTKLKFRIFSEEHRSAVSMTSNEGLIDVSDPFVYPHMTCEVAGMVFQFPGWYALELVFNEITIATYRFHLAGIAGEKK